MYRPIGHRKGTNIITKIPRKMKLPTLVADANAHADQAASSGNAFTNAVRAVAQHAIADASNHAPPPHDATPPSTASQTNHAETAMHHVPAKQAAHDEPTTHAQDAPVADASAAHGAPGRLHVTADVLNVRSSPTTRESHNIIGHVPRGTPLEAHDRTGDWISITYNGQRGFVHGAYVAADPVPAHHSGHAADQPSAPSVAGNAETPTHAEAPAHAHVAARAPALHTHPTTSAAGHPHAAAPGHAEAPPAHARATSMPAARHADPAILRAEYQMLLTSARAGFLTPGTAVEAFIKFDRENNGGQMSTTGIELVGMMPIEIANAQVAHPHQKAQPNAAHDPTQDTRGAHAAPAHETPAKGTDPAASTGGAAGTWAPPANAQMTDASLAQLGAQLHDPKADQVLKDLAGVMAVAAKMKPHLTRGVEAAGVERENLVAGIHAVREGLQSLAGGDAKVEAFKVAVNHKVEALSPYYAQVNIMTIESHGGWSTCNMTSLAMSLSTIGKNADAYKESKRPTIVAVAKHFSGDVKSARQVTAGHDATWASLRGLRLPDFVEFAAIANRLHSPNPTDAEIAAAAAYAVAKKTNLSFLAEIAQDFGAKATLSSSTIGKDTNALKNIGDAHHFDADKLVDARNRAEANPSDAKAQQAFENANKKLGALVSNESIEKQLPVEQYKAEVMKVIKPLLDSGAGVISGTYNHFTHCYEMTEDHIRVQDPGHWDRADRKITWEEARALEYFWNYLVVR